MRSILGDLAGGGVLIILATVVGIGHNAVRSNPVKLIQDGAPVSTAQKNADEAALTGRSMGADAPGAPGADATAAERALPEGAISLAEVKRLFDENAAFILDARPPSAFEEGHIPGAINIPYDRLPDYMAKLSEGVPPDEQVVCYCWSPTCDFSDQLATELKFMGYTKVSVFTGGWDEWKAAGYPTEGTAAE